ncbi:hypothetical protein Tdes44962_MAKER03852 [Teratosphaeria destructans]|uniref:Uncharacterized protein n=1 Tax=Teratosphaeria destructans TaxID=418781 RepID=A0A9W7SNZ6_9PEZI|nr:hypothetical protein Tdes44962_MAKER03852 [Teratosphaeria destructans]
MAKLGQWVSVGCPHVEASLDHSYFAGQSTALAIPVAPHLLRDPQGFLRVDDGPTFQHSTIVSVVIRIRGRGSDSAIVVLFRPDIAFQAQDYDGDVFVVVEVRLDDPLPLGREGGQAGRVSDAVAQDQDRRPEEGVVGRRRCVGEFETVGSVVELDVEGVGLVEVPE